MGKDYPFIHPQKKKWSKSPPWRERCKAKESEKGKVTVCNGEFCESPSKEYFRKPLAIFFNFQELPRRRQRETLSKWDNPHCPWKAFFRSDGNFRQKRKASDSRVKVWKEQNSETRFHLWTKSKLAVKTIDLQMHHRLTKALQSGMSSKQSLQGLKHTNYTKSSSRQQDTTVMSTEETSSEATSLRRRRIPREAWRYIPKKGRTWPTVAPRYKSWNYLLWTKERSTLFDSLAKIWIFRPPMALWSQARKQRSTSRSAALIYGYIWWKTHRQRHR